jgi:hypothetical protein
MESFLKLLLSVLLVIVIFFSLILYVISRPTQDPTASSESEPTDSNESVPFPKETNEVMIHCLKKDSEGKKTCEKSSMEDCEENHKGSYLSEGDCNRALKNWKDQIDKVYCLDEEKETCDEVRIESANDGCPEFSMSYSTLEECENSI